MMANQCVTCGAEMPEGDHVCKGCRAINSAAKKIEAKRNRIAKKQAEIDAGVLDQWDTKWTQDAIKWLTYEVSELEDKMHRAKTRPAKAEAKNRVLTEMPEGGQEDEGCRTRRAIYPHGLNVRVNDAQMAAIERACLLRNMRISEVVREALDVWMKVEVEG